MIKIGIIGLGDIATKAYLPVFTNKSEFEFHLCSRNEVRLNDISARYRFHTTHTNLDSLIKSGIIGAFVHAATDSRFEIVKKLLEENIHVFVDKPITMRYELSKQLTEIAKERNLFFMVGFNRRFSPVYQRLKEIKEPTLIIMQKNRESSPDLIRNFIIDDFIHVVDTLRFLFPLPIDDLIVHGIIRQKLMYQVVIQFVSKTGAVAIGIMNRDGNLTEEKVEVMSRKVKAIAINLSGLVVEESGMTSTIRNKDWESMLFKRGFEQMTDYFLQAISTNKFDNHMSRDALLTHEICERIVEKLELQQLAQKS